MGLASSQARLLMLTARKSDLEYRAQTISQQKINIARQQTQLATEYNRNIRIPNTKILCIVWEEPTCP